MELNMDLPVYISPVPLSAGQVASLNPLVLAGDWEGKITDWDVHFVFAVDPERIHYHASMPVGPGLALKNPPAPHKNEFFEGLWEDDVAEFFIKSDTAGSYQEFNLSPDGRWWSAHFSAYRERTGVNCGMNGVKTFSKCGDKRAFWGMSIPRSELKVDIGFSPASRMFITAIVNTPDQEFLIWSAPPSPTPDFHLMQYAPAVVPVPVG